MVLKLLVLLAVAGFSSVSSAETYPAIYTNLYLGYDQFYTSLSTACSSRAVSGGTWTVNSTSPPQCLQTFSNGVTSVWGVVTNAEYRCPGTGTLSGTSCINATPCSFGTRSTVTGLCPTLTNCVGLQNPVTTGCRYQEVGTPIDCLDGSTVYSPNVCPIFQNGKWDRFGHLTPYCSPVADYVSQHSSGCTPLTLGQHMNSWADAITSIGGLATAALASIAAPEWTIAPLLLGELATALTAEFPLLTMAEDGSVVSTQFAAEVPPTVFGNAVTDFIKNNPTDPYVQNLPARINNLSNAPDVVIDSATGQIKTTGSNIPFTPNQVTSVLRSLNPTLPLPMAQIGTYIVPQNIPWVRAAETALASDLKSTAPPQFFPQTASSSSLIRQPYPYSTSPNVVNNQPFSLPPESTVRGLTPFVNFNPLSPNVYIPTSPINSPYYNANPTGLPVTSNPPPPPPSVPVDPTTPDLPPVPPDIFPDVYKYFDFLPMSNPFHFDLSSFLPSLPSSSCYYEIHGTFHVPFLGYKHFDLAPCVPLQPLRTVLGWAFSVLSLWVCFVVIFRSQV